MKFIVHEPDVYVNTGNVWEIKEHTQWPLLNVRMSMSESQAAQGVFIRTVEHDYKRDFN